MKSIKIKLSTKISNPVLRVILSVAFFCAGFAFLWQYDTTLAYAAILIALGYSYSK